MIWLAWRQYRLAIIAAAAAAGALAVWMLVVAHNDQSAFEALARLRCQAYSSLSGSGPFAITCMRLSNGKTSAEDQAVIISRLLVALPLLLGLLTGPALVAGELEHKTNRLIWTQSVSRTRWLVSKWLLAALAVSVLTEPLALLALWWLGHVPGALGQSRIIPGLFDVTGIVPVAYSLFALSLGAALGALARRVATALLGTIVFFIAVRVAVVHLVRPWLVTPLFSATLAGTTAGTPPGYVTSWSVAYGLRTISGFRHPATGHQVAVLLAHCPNATFLHCLAMHGQQMGWYYQPLSHYWPLQAAEAAIYLGFALVLFGATLWAVRRWRA